MMKVTRTPEDFQAEFERLKLQEEMEKNPQHFGPQVRTPWHISNYTKSSKSTQRFTNTPKHSCLKN